MTPLQQAVIDAALTVAEHFEYSDQWQSEDKSWCPYARRGLPGADPEGTCGYGCIDEPSCMTDAPWPMQALAVAVADFLADAEGVTS